MTLPYLICQYCSHRAEAAASVCEHCGAPLTALESADPGRGVEAEELARTAAGTVGGATGKLVAAAGPVLAGQVRTWQWRAVAGVVAVLVVLAVAVLHSCSGMPSGGPRTPVDALPSVLRDASTCTRFDADGRYRCIISPGSALLVGEITGGRQLTYYLQIDPPDRLASTIARWRAAGGTVVSDAAVFLEIGPSETVWYADTRTGFHLETGTFASESDARAFLLRSGLAA